MFSVQWWMPLWAYLNIAVDFMRQNELEQYQRFGSVLLYLQISHCRESRRVWPGRSRLRWPRWVRHEIQRHSSRRPCQRSVARPPTLHRQEYWGTISVKISQQFSLINAYHVHFLHLCWVARKSEVKNLILCLHQQARSAPPLVFKCTSIFVPAYYKIEFYTKLTQSEGV